MSEVDLHVAQGLGTIGGSSSGKRRHVAWLGQQSPGPRQRVRELKSSDAAQICTTTLEGEDERNWRDAWMMEMTVLSGQAHSHMPPSAITSATFLPIRSLGKLDAVPGEARMLALR